LNKRNRAKQRIVQDTKRQPVAAVKMPEPKMPRGLTTDSFSNVLARLGHGTPNLLEGTDYINTRLTQNFQLMNSLYRGHWIIRRIIDTIPEDATRNWITLTTQLQPDDIRKVDKLWRVRRVKQKILQGLKWGRLYGGAIGLILIESHEDILHKPLDFDTIMPGTFKGLMIVDRWSGAYPSQELVEDINDVEFGLPQSYKLTTEDGQVLNVHHTRVIRFTGRELPYFEKIAETYWGASEVEVVYDELKKRDNTSWNIAQLIFLANLRVLKMGDLGQDLAIGDEKVQADIYNTLQAQNILMSNMGMYLLGKDDGFETHQYSFAGLNDIYESFMLDVAGACQIPVTKLFGRAPAGMNSTGESDMQNYYETVQQMQETTLGPILDKLLPIMCMSELGAIPDDIDYMFNPIRTPNDKDIAELAKNKTDAILAAFTGGAIGQKTVLKELKQMGDTTGMFTNITDEDIENAEEAPDTGELLGLGGDLDYGEPMGSKKENRMGLPKGPSNFDARPRRLASWIRRTFRNN
jgi:phage-related protein (TIGR01555 family)